MVVEIPNKFPDRTPDILKNPDNPFNVFLENFLSKYKFAGPVLREMDKYRQLRHGVASACIYEIAVGEMYKQGLIDNVEAQKLFTGTGGVLLHDIGKMGADPVGVEQSLKKIGETNKKNITNGILSTTDTRTQENIAQNQLHPTLGGKAIKLFGKLGIFPEKLADFWSQIAFNHEEEHYLNGNKLGYARKEFRESDDVLYYLLAKLADGVALKEKREYKEPLSQYHLEVKYHDIMNDELVLKAAEQLKPWKGKQFDREKLNGLRNQIISIFINAENSIDEFVNMEPNFEPIFRQYEVHKHDYLAEIFQYIWKNDKRVLMKLYEKGLKTKNYDLTREKDEEISRLMLTHPQPVVPILGLLKPYA